jgi:hypothetical protein
MRTTILTFTIVAFASLSNQCSQHSGFVDRQSNSATPSASPSSSIENDVKVRKAVQAQVQVIQGAIQRESLKLKINNLRDTASEAETEIRIWVGFGMLYPRCFIMKELNGRREAFYIAPKTIGGKKDVQGEVPMTKLSLESPKSGWNEFAEFIKKQGVDSPMKLSLDAQYLPDPDEESIAIESKSHGNYEIVFYTLSTKSEDGQKALQVCRKIEQEFGIKMGCAEVR